MSVYDSIMRYIVTPVLNFSIDAKTRKYSRELEESQWWPRDRILELQGRRLRELARYAYDKVPYYRHIFEEKGLKPEDIRCSADLPKLPVLTKQVIRENFERMMAHGFPSKEKVLSRTGGSTGEPLAFYKTREERQVWASANQRRINGWWGYRMGDKRILIMKKHSRMSAIDRIRLALSSTLIVEPWEISKELPLFTKKLEKFQPEFIHGYPSSLYQLARFIERQGESKIRPKGIITYSEQLYDFQRELISRVFQCDIFIRYAAWETEQIAAECVEHSGYHISAESLILEIVDEAGYPLPAGMEGRIVITNLKNYAMPLIRYDMGDIGVLSDEVCHCGRGLPVLTRLSGRTTDFLLTRAGARIPGMALSFRIFAAEGVEQFQIVQETPGQMIIKVVLTQGQQKECMDKLEEKIASYYQNAIGKDMDILVQFVDYIETTKDGKRKILVSNLLGESDSNFKRSG